MVVVQRKKTKQHLYIVMAISFIIASVLSVYPLSAEIALFRPDFLADISTDFDWHGIGICGWFVC